VAVMDAHHEAGLISLGITDVEKASRYSRLFKIDHLQEATCSTLNGDATHQREEIFLSGEKSVEGTLCTFAQY
jgi:hypothetical protein